MMQKYILAGAVILNVVGCSPEVGSDKWCENMKQKPTGDWTHNETAEYAKNCIFKFGGKND